MVKSKFGDGLMSKSIEAQTNEVLCKVLCHNIVVVGQAAIEFGIAPEFCTQRRRVHKNHRLRALLVQGAVKSPLIVKTLRDPYIGLIIRFSQTQTCRPSRTALYRAIHSARSAGGRPSRLSSRIVGS